MHRNQRTLEEAVRSQRLEMLDLAAAARTPGDPLIFRTAVTRVRVLALPRLPAGHRALLLEPITGRKHQLRQHAAYVLGAPLVGDLRYPAAARRGGREGPGEAEGGAEDAESEEGEDEGSSEGLLLHSLGLQLTTQAGREIRIMSPLPQRFHLDEAEERELREAAAKFLTVPF